MADAPEEQNEQSTTPAAGTPADGEAVEQEAQEAPAGADEGGDQGNDDEFDALPQKTKDEIKALRAENAARRRRERELEEKLSGAKSQEDIDAAVSEYRQTIAKLEEEKLRSSVARKAKLPDDFVELLKGDTEEELLAHAKKLAKHLVRDADEDDDHEPDGGLTPGGKNEVLDPAKLAAGVKRFSAF